MPGRGGGDRGGRGRGGGGRGGPPPPGVDDATLIKQRNKIEKILANVRQLEQRRAKGESLDANQKAKLQRRSELEEELRQVYLQGTAEQRERLGVCGNCGRAGHKQADCPRASQVPSSAAPAPAPAARGGRRGDGREGRGGSQQRGGRGRGGGERGGSRGGARGSSRPSPSQTRQAEPRASARPSHPAAPAPAATRSRADNAQGKAGQRARAGSRFVECPLCGQSFHHSKVEAHAATCDGRHPGTNTAPSPAESDRSGTGGAAESLLSSMFAYRAPPTMPSEDEEEEQEEERGRRKGKPKKVVLDRHGLPLNNRAPPSTFPGAESSFICTLAHLRNTNAS